MLGTNEVVGMPPKYLQDRVDEFEAGGIDLSRVSISTLEKNPIHASRAADTFVNASTKRIHAAYLNACSTVFSLSASVNVMMPDMSSPKLVR